MFFSLIVWSFVSAPSPAFAPELSAPSPSGSKTIERIEARVGTQIITTSELRAMEALIKSLEPRNPSEKTLRQRALDLLIEQALIRDFLAKREMAISEQDIERRVQGLRSSQGLSSYEELQQLLASKGGSLEQLRTDLRMQLENQAFFAAIKREGLQSIQESDLKNYYQQNRDQFDQNIELTVQECMIDAAAEKADALVSKYVSQPGLFEECVRLHSISPSKARQGMLGSITRGILREEVESVLFSTAVGRVARVSLPNATQLLKVLSKKNLGAQSFDQARSQIESILEAQQMNKAKERVLNELRSSTFIKIES